MNHVGKLILFFVFSLVLHGGGLLIHPPAATVDSRDTVVGVALLSTSGEDFLPLSRGAEESLTSSDESAPEQREAATQNDDVASEPDVRRASESHETLVVKKQKEQKIMNAESGGVSRYEASEETPGKEISELLNEKVVVDKAAEKSGTSGQLSSIGEIKEDPPDNERVGADSVETEKQKGAETAVSAKMEQSAATAAASEASSPLANPGEAVDRGMSASMADPGDKKEKIQRSALPFYDENPRPEYPKVARLRGWEGTVRLEVLVLKDGRVGHVDLVDSSGYSSLDRIARRTVHRWKFKPALSMGIAVDSKVQVPISFQLN